MRWVIPWCLLAAISTGCGKEDMTKSAASVKPPEAKQAAFQESTAEGNAKSPLPPGGEALQRKIIKEFVPGEPVTYRTRVRQAWDESLGALVSIGQSLSVLLVVLSPWIGVLLPPLALVILARRLRWARKA